MRMCVVNSIYTQRQRGQNTPSAQTHKDIATQSHNGSKTQWKTQRRKGATHEDTHTHTNTDTRTQADKHRHTNTPTNAGTDAQTERQRKRERYLAELLLWKKPCVQSTIERPPTGGPQASVFLSVCLCLLCVRACVCDHFRIGTRQNESCVMSCCWRICVKLAGGRGLLPTKTLPG